MDLTAGSPAAADHMLPGTTEQVSQGTWAGRARLQGNVRQVPQPQAPAFLGELHPQRVLQ